MKLARFGGERAELPAFEGIPAQYHSMPTTVALRARLLSALGCLALLPSAAYGSAFSIAENGARAAGMGTAFTSVADDGSAIFYNPAGIAFSEGTNFELHNLAVVGLFRFVPSDPPPGQQVLDSQTDPRPHDRPFALCACRGHSETCRR